MSNDNHTRQPEGTPTGGQFATDAKSEPVGVALATDGDPGELARLEAQFEAAGGRGVELADRIDALRHREDALEANRLIDGAYDSITHSSLLSDLRFDPMTGDPVDDYPEDAHEDAVRALRRYRDASNHVVAGTRDPDRVLDGPYRMPVEAVAAADENGRLTGVVRVELVDMVEAGSESDDLATLLVEDLAPFDTSMEPIGVGGDGCLHLRVSTNLRKATDLELGDGRYDAMRRELGHP